MKRFLIFFTLCLVSFTSVKEFPKFIDFYDRSDCTWKSMDVNLLTTEEKMYIVRNHCESWFKYYEEEHPKNSRTQKKKKKFIRETAPIAVYMYLFQEDVLPSVKISQAAIESGYCKTRSCKRKNNVFNIKSKVCTPKKCVHKLPCTNINDDDPNDMFLSFGSRWDSFAGHGALVKTSKHPGGSYRYKKALSRNSAKEQIKIIRKGGYATLDYDEFVKRHTRITDELVTLDEMAQNLKEQF